jgi:hypothetical protein
LTPPRCIQKKGGAAQKQIKQIQAQAASSKSADQKRKDAEKEQREREKKAAEEARRETAELFKPVQTQKVPFGVDPKTVVCQFFKKGHCDKGESSLMGFDSNMSGGEIGREHVLTDGFRPEMQVQP